MNEPREVGEGRERRTGAEQLVPSTSIKLPLRNIGIFIACVAILGMPRPEGPHKLQSKSRSDQVTGANTLVGALTFVAKATEEGGHCLLLVARTLKVVREAAT